jgi:hypothetical protein
MSYRHLLAAAELATATLFFGAAPPATPVGSGVAPPCDRACVDSLPLGGSSSSMQAGELFRIDRGRITAVEAMDASLPFGTKSGWGE